MIRATDVHSVTDFTRNTKAYIAKLKETKDPMVLTVNGGAEIVVQDAAAYQTMLDEIENVRLLQALREGIKDSEEGRGIPLERFVAEMKAKYDL
ncbi:MAG TPA: type II toxin-antitoxin system Phd/YefM family antitoxin [Fimbriimonas sp.]|nr:type II toxin-antitoxin system Phd/YefM family antitoxin [Fimbriimonas sp.]